MWIDIVGYCMYVLIIGYVVILYVLIVYCFVGCNDFVLVFVLLKIKFFGKRIVVFYREGFWDDGGEVRCSVLFCIFVFWFIW